MKYGKCFITLLLFLYQENNKQQSKTRFTSPKAVGRKSKTRLSKSKQDISDVSKGEIISDSKPVAAPEPQPQIQLVQMQQQSLGKVVSFVARARIS